MDFLDTYHLTGLAVGLCTFLVIGLFHPLVIKAEYRWGTRCWWVFLLAGIAGTAATVYTDNLLLSALLGVFSFSSFWAIREIFEQEKRVRKGWFPMNPQRTMSPGGNAPRTGRNPLPGRHEAVGRVNNQV